MLYYLAILIVCVTPLCRSFCFNFHAASKAGIGLPMHINKVSIPSNKILMSTSPLIRDASSNQDGNFFKSILVSGFVSKANNFAQPFAMNKLFQKGTWESITTTTDDTKFARKRLVDPSSVYSGLIDILQYAEVSDKATLQTSLSGKDVWLAYGLESSDLAEYCSVAANAGVKRVVFAVKVSEFETKLPDLIFSDACSILSDAGIAYTIIKYSSVATMAEAKFPYRIVRGSKPLPDAGSTPLSSEDLMRVLVEVVDLPKTYNAVYGIGPGTQLDTEILVYMKAQGWPERVQVGLLMGDMMEKIEASYEAEKRGALSPSPTTK